jgi:hypothetical protein
MYVLIWHSQYGKEEIDECDSLEEALTLQVEYQMAYGGAVTVKEAS